MQNELTTIKIKKSTALKLKNSDIRSVCKNYDQVINYLLDISKGK